MEIYQTPFIWLVALLFLLYILIKNNKIQESLLVIALTGAEIFLVNLLGMEYVPLASVVFLSLVIKSGLLTVMLVVWGSVLLGIWGSEGLVSLLHIGIGGIGGALIGFVTYLLFRLVLKRILSVQTRCISNQYTSSGYLKSDIVCLCTILLLTLFGIVIMSLVIN
ncbi:MAG: hypothetical protein J6B31_02785 [Bacteroidaceae bacterium]|nr:hypothetical protein [Bacteroidaceae bacterium]